MRIKKIPIRKCVVTKQTLPKKEMIRIVLNKANQVFVDRSGKANGKGIYIQPKIELVAVAKKQKVFEKALKTTIPDELYQILADEITNSWD